jgi:hypothetical protein
LIALASALLITASTVERLAVLSTVAASSPAAAPGGDKKGAPTGPERIKKRVWLRPSKRFGFFFPTIYHTTPINTAEDPRNSGIAQK